MNNKHMPIYTYFIVTSDEDGTQIRGPMSESEALENITPDGDGDFPLGKLEFLDRVPLNDGGYWNVKTRDEKATPAILIRGTIVVPEPVETVTSYKI